jgi:DNA-binding winged helix-turn-helix (wHTH) protein/TolB-like protein/Tfp pilus assembly protein PilF
MSLEGFAPAADPVPSEHLVRFGAFELDRSTGELTCQGRRVPLQDQPARVLCLLTAKPNQLISREELRQALWSDDTFVEFEAALSVAIMKIRQALGDSAGKPRFVETIPKRGYRFLADVRAAGPAVMVAAPPTSTLPDEPRRRSWIWLLGLAVLTFAAVVLFAQRSRNVPAAPPAPRSIAVLPFQPLVAGASDEALEFGMTASLITKLSRIPGLTVSPMASVRRFVPLDQDPIEAGRVLGVEAVLESHVQRTANRMRVMTRLLRVSDGQALWAQEWNDEGESTVGVEGRMSEALADALKLSLAGAVREAIRTPETANPEAQERFFFGKHHLSIREGRRFAQAEQAFREAIELDPLYARAHAGLSLALSAVAWSGDRPGSDVIAPAKAAALEALRLDDSIAEAHTALAVVHEAFEFDRPAAEREHLRAMSLDDQDWYVLISYAVFLMNQDRADEALAVTDRHLRLDPTSPLAHRNRAMAFYVARRYDECVNQSRKTLELDRRYVTAYQWLWACLAEQGKHQEAVEAWEEWRAIDGGASARLTADRMKALYHSRGWQAYLTESLAVQPDAPDLARTRARLLVKAGRHDDAITALERALERRDPWIVMLNQPEWDPLRGDARFQAIRRRTGARGL